MATATHDRGHDLTDELLSEVEKRVAAEYRKAAKEAEDKLADYMRRFEIKDQIKRKQLEAGIITKDEYDTWRTGQIMMGERWERLRDNLASDYHNANGVARSVVSGYMPDVYALNHDYATYLAEKGARVDTSYTLYDRQTAERILRDQPDLLPGPGTRMQQAIAERKDIAWQAGQIQSVTLQSILQGESIPDMARRIAREMGEIDHKATIRYARTACTAAESAGRLDGYRRASDMGIKMRQTWVATLDNRTRHEHRMLDGQTVDIDEPFVVDGEEIRYPGDPAAAPHLIWNCRCRTIAQVKGFERDVSNQDLRHDAHLGNMSYDEWREAKATSERITKQEEIARRMARRTIEEDYKR